MNAKWYNKRRYGSAAGCATAIEKGFQFGGDRLRKEGYRIESLAIIEELSDSGVRFRKE